MSEWWFWTCFPFVVIGGGILLTLIDRYLAERHWHRWQQKRNLDNES